MKLLLWSAAASVQFALAVPLASQDALSHLEVLEKRDASALPPSPPDCTSPPFDSWLISRDNR